MDEKNLQKKANEQLLQIQRACVGLSYEEVVKFLSFLAQDLRKFVEIYVNMGKSDDKDRSTN